MRWWSRKERVKELRMYQKKTVRVRLVLRCMAHTLYSWNGGGTVTNTETARDAKMQQTTNISVTGICSFWSIHEGCLMFCISAAHRHGDMGWRKYETREPPRIHFLKLKRMKKNQNGRREWGILINKSGIRAINRQRWIFRTLGGRGVESAEVAENWRLAFK